MAKCKECNREVRWTKTGKLEDGKKHYCTFYSWLCSTPMSKRKGEISNPPFAVLALVLQKCTAKTREDILKLIKSRAVTSWKMWNELYTAIQMDLS